MRLPLPALFIALVLALAAAAPLRASILGEDFNVEEKDDYAGLPLLRLSVDAGFSQWIISNDSTLTKAGNDYVDDQQSGKDLSADAVYYFLPRGGVGLTWIWFLSNTEARNIVLHEGQPAMDIEERFSMTYLGPSFWTRIRAGRFGLAHVGFGAGYLGILDTWTEDGVPHKIEANTYAIVTSLGWEYSLFRFLGLGLTGRFVFSNIDEWTYDGEKVKAEDTEDQYMWYNVPLYRLELNAGLRFFL